MSTGTDMFGKETLKSKYQKWYGKDHALMGKIGYSHLKTNMLDKKSALLTGRYTLYEPGEQPAKGVFTLVYSKTPVGWKIIHEHLSKFAIKE